MLRVEYLGQQFVFGFTWILTAGANTWLDLPKAVPQN